MFYAIVGRCRWNRSQARILAKGVERRIDPADGQAWDSLESEQAVAKAGWLPAIDWP